MLLFSSVLAHSLHIFKSNWPVGSRAYSLARGGQETLVFSHQRWHSVGKVISPEEIKLVVAIKRGE